MFPRDADEIQQHGSLDLNAAAQACYLRWLRDDFLYASKQPVGRYAGPVTSSAESSSAPDPLISDAVRDPLAATGATLAARQRPMSERLELALSWNSVAAELRVGLLAITRHTNPRR
jgi:hypothetical protein